MKWHSWLIIGALMAVLLLVDGAGALVWNSLVGDNWRLLFAIVIGICVAQVNLIAIWAALAPGRVMLRFPWSIFLAALMWYALVLGSRIHLEWDPDTDSMYPVIGDYNISMGDAVVLGLIILAGILSVQLPLWAMSRWFAWRLSPPASHVQSRDEEHQFNLKHLIAGMVLASVALGLGRAILPSGEWGSLRLDRELTVILPAILIVNLIAVVPCIWIAFVRTALLLPLAFTWLVWATLTSIVEIAILSAILGPPPGDVWFYFTLFNIAQGLCVLGSLLMLRIAGFRFARWRESEKSAQATVTVKPPLDIMQPSDKHSTTPITSAEHRS